MSELVLGDIPGIAKGIKVAKVKVIKCLHNLVFENDGDRGNRQRLRTFAGFGFPVESDQFRDKIAYAKEKLTDGDVTSIANVLGIDYDDTTGNLIKEICTKLTDVKLLQDDDEDEDDEDEETDEEEEDDKKEDDKEKEDDRSNGDTETQSDENERPNENQAKKNDRVKKTKKTTRTERSPPAASHQSMPFTMSFRDVEESVRKFDGSQGNPVEKWISDMEEMAELFKWSDLHLFIFAKKALSGLAKLFIQGERGITSWKHLKRALKDEYSSRLNSAQLHGLLGSRKMKKSEDVQEYLLIMKEIAGRGAIEEDALIQYVIDGIPGDNSSKMLLYGAKSIREFKEKLRVFNNFKKAQTQPEQRSVPAKRDSEHSTEASARKASTIRCFNCGKKGHKSSECESKEMGAKCFNCNKFGHKAATCTSKKERDDKGKAPQSPAVNSITTVPLRKMSKTMRILDTDVEALIDTGSQVNVIKEAVYHRLGSPTLHAAETTLNGFGNATIAPLGQFRCSVIVDDCPFNTRILVVQDDAMERNDAIIGNELLSNAELIVNQDGVKIKMLCQNDHVEEVPALMSIQTNCEFEEDIGDVQESTRIETRRMIREYTPDKCKTTKITMKIVVKDDEPIYRSPRRLPFSERTIVDRQVEEWIENGIVEPSNSEYASQVVVTRKKDGSPRICIDYRDINRKIVKDRYPLPLIEDQLDKLQNARIFSTIDLKNGFFHVDVDEDSKKYTSFVTHKGQFQFLKVPFGLCNSPAVFQRFINTVFRELISQNVVLPYMDDLIIPAAHEEEAVEKLRLVLQTAREYGLEINKKKCHFLKEEIEFLGHIITKGKLRPSRDKTKAVMNFPEPTTPKQLQSFLGLTSYFRKFIPYYSIVARPLSDLLKKDQTFRFLDEQRAAFRKLKEILADGPVLSIYRQGSELELHTDASKEGYGGILLQRSEDDNCLHPVYYISKKTTDAEKKYCSYELEVLAVIEALKRLRVYLLGSRFKIITDCSAFQKTMAKKDLSARVARWAMMLEEFDYTIEHRAGTRMRHVDALSRFPVLTISQTIPLRMKQAQEEDRELRAVKEILKERPYESYFLKNDLLYRLDEDQELLVVPKKLQIEIVKNAHEQGHFAVKKTEDLISKEYYIPQLREKISRFINNCVPCILSNRKRGKQEGYLHPLRKDCSPLATYHVDHIGPLESTNKNYKHILSVIDSFTKFVWLYPTKSTTAGEVIQKLELQRKTFGNPTSIISDKGTAFTAQEFSDYCETNDIHHHHVTTGLPRANGQIERVNSTIASVLSKLSIEDPTKWYKWVDQVQSAINSTYQRSIKTTPFELLVGVPMRTRSDSIRKLIEEELQKNFEESRDDLRRAAKLQLAKVQEENRKTYNLRRKTPTVYRLHDLVAIKRTQFGPGLKLRGKFLGPYQVTRVKAKDTYEVRKVGVHEGPGRTTTCAEFMKPWSQGFVEDDPPSETDEIQDGRSVGIREEGRPSLRRGT